MNSIADPVDSWVSTNGLVLWVHEDDFEKLEHGVLAHPVGIEHTKCTAVPASPLLHTQSVATHSNRRKQQKEALIHSKGQKPRVEARLAH